MENAGSHPPTWDRLVSEETNEEKEKGSHFIERPSTARQQTRDSDTGVLTGGHDGHLHFPERDNEAEVQGLVQGHTSPART